MCIVDGVMRWDVIRMIRACLFFVFFFFRTTKSEIKQSSRFEAHLNCLALDWIGIMSHNLLQDGQHVGDCHKFGHKNGLQSTSTQPSDFRYHYLHSNQHRDTIPLLPPPPVEYISQIGSVGIPPPTPLFFSHHTYTAIPCVTRGEIRYNKRSTYCTKD